MGSRCKVSQWWWGSVEVQKREAAGRSEPTGPSHLAPCAQRTSRAWEERHSTLHARPHGSGYAWWTELLQLAERGGQTQHEANTAFGAVTAVPCEGCAVTTWLAWAVGGPSGPPAAPDRPKRRPKARMEAASGGDRASGRCGCQGYRKACLSCHCGPPGANEAASMQRRNAPSKRTILEEPLKGSEHGTPTGGVKPPRLQGETPPPVLPPACMRRACD